MFNRVLCFSAAVAFLMASFWLAVHLFKAHISVLRTASGLTAVCRYNPYCMVNCRVSSLGNVEPSSSVNLDSQTCCSHFRPMFRLTAFVFDFCTVF